MKPEIEAFLREPHVCVLATTGPGDWPHAMPMWYLWKDGAIVFGTGRGSQKVRNVQRTGKATVLVDRRTPPYYAVMVRGAAQVGPAFTVEQMRRIAVRYLGEAGAKRYLERRGAPDSASILVQPHRLVEYHGISAPP